MDSPDECSTDDPRQGELDSVSVREAKIQPERVCVCVLGGYCFTSIIGISQPAIHFVCCFAVKSQQT